MTMTIKCDVLSRETTYFGRVYFGNGDYESDPDYGFVVSLKTSEVDDDEWDLSWDDYAVRPDCISVKMEAEIIEHVKQFSLTRGGNE